MYNFKITEDITEKIYFAIVRYYKNYNGDEIKKHFNISQQQFQNIHQQMDVGGPYNSFNKMYLRYNKESGTRHNVKITKLKYKNTILLLLSYNYF